MTHLDEARISLTAARDQLREVLDLIADKRGQSMDAPDLDAFLGELDNKLFNEVDENLHRTGASLISLDVEAMGEEIQGRLNILHGLVASARTVTQQDIDNLDQQAKNNITRFADSLAEVNPEPIDRDELTALIQAFQEDIARQQDIGDKVARVVSTLTTISRTALKVLAPI